MLKWKLCYQPGNTFPSCQHLRNGGKQPTATGGKNESSARSGWEGKDDQSWSLVLGTQRVKGTTWVLPPCAPCCHGCWLGSLFWLLLEPTQKHHLLNLPPGGTPLPRLTSWPCSPVRSHAVILGQAFFSLCFWGLIHPRLTMELVMRQLKVPISPKQSCS